jgi:hypothetical protein
MLVGDPFKDNNLINDIKATYLEYKLINRTLDILFLRKDTKARSLPAVLYLFM